MLNETFSVNLLKQFDVFLCILQIPLEPLHLSVTGSHVIVASRDAFFVWHFRTAQSWTTLKFNDKSSQNNKSSEKFYHVDDTPAGGVHSASRGGRGSAKSEGGSSGAGQFPVTNDPICCITASEKNLLVARESGLVQRYALPNVALTNRYHISTKAHKLALNCNST